MDHDAASDDRGAARLRALVHDIETSRAVTSCGPIAIARVPALHEVAIRVLRD